MKKAYDYHRVALYDNRHKEGEWIRDGSKMVVAMPWKCPFCHDRDTKPKPYCHGCGAKLRKKDE
jgi:hypothetical protein